MSKLNIFLHHRDIRYQDNTTMIKQLKEVKSITPIFIFDPIQINPEKNKYFSNGLVEFMIESLKEYENDIKDKKGKLYFFYGDSLEILKYIHHKIGINSIGFNYEYSPFGKKRDKQIIKFAEDENIQIYCEEDILLHNILDDQTLNPKNGKPYLVYTPYYNHLQNLQVREVDNFKKFKFLKNLELEKIKYLYNDLDSLYIKNENLNVHGGRKNALKILKNLKEFDKYVENRDQLTYQTTMLSSYINFNIVSVREIYESIIKTFDKKHGLIRELIFRDYYHTIVHLFPHVIGGNFYQKFDKVKWDNNIKHFNAWCKGETGYPIVDAAMKQLVISNYMHNRMRMMSASFLIKNLQVDWRKGERFFAQNLEDYNIYNNWGGWTNIADCAPSGQSYFRVFSPEAHSKKYDKNCEYIKKWLPELENVPNEDIHSWEKNHQKYLDKGIQYHSPIVDFSKSRNEFLKFYKKYQ
jgi:deoxyribodipyrimidine photo-lyase